MKLVLNERERLARELIAIRGFIRSADHNRNAEAAENFRKWLAITKHRAQRFKHKRILRREDRTAA